MFIIRFAFYFVISFAILCIPVGGGQQLFDKLFTMVTPYARDAVKTTKQKITSTKRYSKKLYSNSSPAEQEEDQVKSKMAAVKRKGTKVIEKQNKKPDDTYTDEEQERLRKALTDE